MRVPDPIRSRFQAGTDAGAERGIGNGNKVHVAVVLYNALHLCEKSEALDTETSSSFIAAAQVCNPLLYAGSGVPADGYFMMDDMIGRNGQQLWPEARQFVDRFWGELPEKYKYNHGLKRQETTFEDWDCASAGFEGIRAQDILPLLIEKFHFEFFFAFGNIIDPFIDRSFGPNFDVGSEWDRAFIDRVHAIDMEQIEAGSVKPTHVMAAVRLGPVSAPKFYKHLTPEFCVRRP
jgi:hypothetical protein